MTAFGVTNAWLALAPFFAAVVTAIVLAVRATPSWAMSDFRFAVPAVLTWTWVAALGPRWRAMRSARSSAETSPLSGWSRGRLALAGTLAAIRVRSGALSPARIDRRLRSPRSDRSSRSTRPRRDRWSSYGVGAARDRPLDCGRLAGPGTSAVWMTTVRTPHCWSR